MSAAKSSGKTESSTPAQDLQSENERLRARLAALEAELVEIQTRTDAIVAQAQDRTYWLDRWHVDLNELMRRPGAEELRKAFRGLRWFVRKWRNQKRRWQSR